MSGTAWFVCPDHGDFPGSAMSYVLLPNQVCRLFILANQIPLLQLSEGY